VSLQVRIFQYIVVVLHFGHFLVDFKQVFVQKRLFFDSYLETKAADVLVVKDGVVDVRVVSSIKFHKILSEAIPLAKLFGRICEDRVNGVKSVPSHSRKQT